MLWLSDIRLPAEPEGVRVARRAVDGISAPVSDEQRDDLRLLVSEVATNAIRHGGSTSASSEPIIRLRFGVDSGYLRVEVHDRGPGFVPAPREPDARLDSGWGVHFVRTLADRWGSGRDETGAWIVWFEFGVDGGGTDGEPAAMHYEQRAVDGADRGRGDSAAAPSDRGPGLREYAPTG